MRPDPGREPSDPVGEALHFLHLSGTFYCRSEMSAPWALELPPCEGCLSFHVMVSGACLLELDDGTSRLLNAGDLALVSHGLGHVLRSAAGVEARSIDELEHELVSPRYAVLRHGGGGERTTLICGAVRFEHPAALQLAALLPAVIHVPGSDSPQTDWIQSTLHLMASEAQQRRPGGETVITRLADILVIQAIRSWIEADSAAQSGWLGALHDKRIGRAIALIHRDPARPWTLSSLAAEVGMSRSAFAARFNEIVGEPAIHYLTSWRMHLAATWLNEEGVGVAQMAARLGYRSEAAFSRAFKRHTSISPGSVRRRDVNWDVINDKLTV
jgi:AraC-like DNA-binding protein